MDSLFALLHLAVLPLWVAMLLFPRHRLTERAVLSPWPFIVLGSLSGLLWLGALLALDPSAYGISATALRTLLDTSLGIPALWAQILTLDLFVGVWIFRDTRYWGIRPVPFLLATMLLGPVGLAAYLVRRRRSERNDPIRNLN